MSRLRRIMKGAGSIWFVYPTRPHLEKMKSFWYTRLDVSPHEALASDWQRVGKDLWQAMMSAYRELPDHERPRIPQDWLKPKASSGTAGDDRQLSLFIDD